MEGGAGRSSFSTGGGGTAAVTPAECGCELDFDESGGAAAAAAAAGVRGFAAVSSAPKVLYNAYAPPTATALPTTTFQGNDEAEVSDTII